LFDISPLFVFIAVGQGRFCIITMNESFCSDRSAEAVSRRKYRSKHSHVFWK